MDVECMAEFCDYDWTSGADALSGVEAGIFSVRDGFAKGGSGVCGGVVEEISKMTSRAD